MKKDPPSTKEKQKPERLFTLQEIKEAYKGGWFGYSNSRNSLL